MNILHVVLTSSYVPSVWLNVHECTLLLVKRHHTAFGKCRTNRSAIGRELVSPSSKRIVPITEKLPQKYNYCNIVSNCRRLPHKFVNVQ